MPAASANDSIMPTLRCVRRRRQFVQTWEYVAAGIGAGSVAASAALLSWLWAQAASSAAWLPVMALLLAGSLFLPAAPSRFSRFFSNRLRLSRYFRMFPYDKNLPRAVGVFWAGTALATAALLATGRLDTVPAWSVLLICEAGGMVAAVLSAPPVSLFDAAVMTDQQAGTHELLATALELQASGAGASPAARRAVLDGARAACQQIKPSKLSYHRMTGRWYIPALAGAASVLLIFWHVNASELHWPQHVDWRPRSAVKSASTNKGGRRQIIRRGPAAPTRRHVVPHAPHRRTHEPGSARHPLGKTSTAEHPPSKRAGASQRPRTVAAAALALLDNAVATPAAPSPGAKPAAPKVPRAGGAGHGAAGSQNGGNFHADLKKSLAALTLPQRRKLLKKLTKLLHGTTGFHALMLAAQHAKRTAALAAAMEHLHAALRRAAAAPRPNLTKYKSPGNHARAGVAVPTGRSGNAVGSGRAQRSGRSSHSGLTTKASLLPMEVFSNIRTRKQRPRRVEHQRRPSQPNNLGTGGNPRGAGIKSYPATAAPIPPRYRTAVRRYFQIGH